MRVMTFIAWLLKRVSVLSFRLSSRLSNITRSWKKRKRKTDKEYEKAWEKWVTEEPKKDFWS